MFTRAGQSARGRNTRQFEVRSRFRFRAVHNLMESKHGSKPLNCRASEPDNRIHLSWKRSIAKVSNQMANQISDPGKSDRDR